MTYLPPEVRTLVAAVEPDLGAVAAKSWTLRGDAAVWEITGAGGRRWYAKRHAAPVFHTREIHALTSWVPALGTGRAPSLAAADSHARVIVTTGLPGQPVREQALSEAQEAQVYREAGRLLARYHAAPQTMDSTPPAPQPSWQARVADTMMRAEALLPPDDVGLLRALAAEPPAPLPSVPCHGDYLPRNWLWSPDSPFAVIDFERSEEEAVVVHDLMRLEYRVFSVAPQLRDPFYDGYGRGLTDQEQRACVSYAVLDAVSALHWGAAYEDQDIVRGGQITIARLRADARGK